MLVTVGLSIALFTGVILTLVLVLMWAESKLVHKGDVRVIINDDEDKALKIPAGRTLLQTLSANRIYLPSACGGSGTCGVCRCKIFEGGGDILPTELTHITMKDAREHWRLACQVKVREDMRIWVPEEIFNIKMYECTVRSNNNVASFIKELVLDLPPGEILEFKAGGYIQIEVPEYRGLSYRSFDIDGKFKSEWDKYDMWRYSANNDEPVTRAYSMANYPAENTIVMLNVRIASPPPDKPDVPPGIVSSYIFNLKPGDKVKVSGPYGEFFIKDTDREMVYIGGGAGMAPMRSHIFHLLKTVHSNRKISFWYGARSLKEMFYQNEFETLETQNPNFDFQVALSEPMPEDNWNGPVGFIHQVVLDRHLKKHSDPEEIEYYMCGPPLMNSAVLKMLDNLGVEPDQIAFDDFGI
ncbi:NADH:ubiquinone reductase (Na(+)-transporting) subunit F [bacterium]|nr:NADH:ubiquinone reductase (Na(+)-transporting) subunit F [candidate division CSSED10-310 bacterium]